LPRTVNLIAWDFDLVDVFALSLTDRATLPVLHFTVASNPATFGLDDHAQVFAFLTVAANLTVPPLAPRL
jgi:hypothetical protein